MRAFGSDDLFIIFLHLYRTIQYIYSYLHLILDHPKRVCNSLQTLCALFYSIFKRHAADAAGMDIIRTIFDFDEAEKKMKHLIAKCDLLTSKRDLSEWLD